MPNPLRRIKKNIPDDKNKKISNISKINEFVYEQTD